MAQYRKKPVVIEAEQWFKPGDHSQDKSTKLSVVDGDRNLVTEGQVVRYFRRPDVSDDDVCEKCGETFYRHGWIETLEGGHIVCPGDWIITGIKGEHYPCKPDIFEATYKLVG